MIEVNRERCIGAGMCVLSAPEIFDQSDEDGRVVLLDESPKLELAGRVREALTLCPSQALSVPRNS